MNVAAVGPDREARPGRAVAGLGEQILVEIEPHGAAGGPDPFGQRQHVVPGAAAGVEDSQPVAEIEQVEDVPLRRPDRGPGVVDVAPADQRRALVGRPLLTHPAPPARPRSQYTSESVDSDVRAEET